MRKFILTILSLLILALPSVGWSLDIVPGLKGFGTDSRMAYAGLDTYTGTVTFTATTNRIAGTGIETGMVVNDTVEVSGSTGNDGLYIVTAVNTGYLTVYPTGTIGDEGPTASVGVNEQPTIYVVNTLTKNTAAAYSTRGDVPVITGGFFTAWETETKSNKIILFEVSGNIVITDNVTNIGSYVAVYGETAPSPGVSLDKCTLQVGKATVPGVTDGQTDVFIHHIRVRSGDYDGTPTYSTRRAWSQSDASARMVADHCSFAWGVDQVADNSVSYSTMSNCIIAEGLDRSWHTTKTSTTHGHSKGSFAVGDGDGYNAFIRNLMVGSQDRGPLIQGTNTYVANNVVIHDWTPNLVSNSSDVIVADIIENYIAGSTAFGAQNQVAWLYSGRVVAGSTLYISGNRCDAGTQSSASDWALVRGVDVYPYATRGVAAAQNTPTGYTLIGSATDTLAYVLANAGARPADRDQIDARIVGYSSGGWSGVKYADYVDTPNTDGWPGQTLVQVPEGGYPVLASNTRNIATDMAAAGFSPLPSAATIHDDAGSGYTYLEEWLQTLATFVETGTPPLVACGGPYNNDAAGDTDLVAQWDFEQATWTEDATANNNDLGSGGSAGCQGATGTYAGAWGGEDTEPDTDELCTNSGAGSDKEGTVNGSAQITTDYKLTGSYGLRIDADGENISWAESSGDILDDQEGTVWFDLYAETAGTANTAIFRAYLDGNDEVFVNLRDTGAIYLVHEGGNGSAAVSMTSTNTVSATTWTTIGVAWSVSGNVIAVKVGDNAWETDADADSVTAWSAGSYTVSIGDDNAATGVQNACRFDNFSIHTAYQQNRPSWDTPSGLASPTEETTSPIAGTKSARFDGSSQFFTLADASLSAGFPGKNGTTNRIFSIPMRLSADTFPAVSGFETLIHKGTAWKCGIYNDGGTPKLQMILLDGATPRTYTHGSELLADDVVMFGWNNTTNTATLDVARCSGDTWSRVGTRIDSTDNDFDLAIAAGAVEIGGNSTDLDYFDGLIDEIWVRDAVLSAAKFLEYAEGTYGDPAPALVSMTVTGTTVTAANSTQDMVIVWDQECFYSGPTPYVILESDTTGQEVKFYFASKSGVTETWTSERLQPGWRGTLQLKGTDITIPSGGRITDLQAEDATTTYTALTGTLVLAIPYSGTLITDTLTIGDGLTIEQCDEDNVCSDVAITADFSTVTAAKAAGIVLIPDDNITLGTTTEPGALDLSAYDGTSGHPITVAGGGYTWSGDITFGDYWTVSRVKHASNVILGSNNVHTYSLIPTGSTIQIPEGATGVTIYNDTIAGTLVVSETCALMKNLIVVAVNAAGLGAGETATFTNCYFIQSQAVIQATGGGGAFEFPGCVFSQPSPFVSATDFRLKRSAVNAINKGVNLCAGVDDPFVGCTGAGTGTWTDLDGNTVPNKVIPDIGAYEYIFQNMPSRILFNEFPPFIFLEE